MVTGHFIQSERVRFLEHGSLKHPYGPGYRVYFGRRGNTVVILLYGGDKKTQSRDIALAQANWDEYLQRIK
jgi:putative addiction module killer protein